MTQLVHSLGFWLDNRTIGIRLPARINIFILCTAFRMSVKTTQPNCIGTGLSPWKYSIWSIELASCLHLGPKLRKRGATSIYPVLPDGFITWCLILLANILALAKTYLSIACYSRTTV